MTTLPVPMVCPRCRETENYYGRLVFDGEENVKCPNHGDEEVLLVPSERS